jgi:hypothetical protein
VTDDVKIEAHEVRHAVVEFVAAARIQDAIDAVEAYLLQSKHPRHTLNKIGKLARLGIASGKTFIYLDCQRYQTEDDCGADDPFGPSMGEEGEINE